MRRWLGGTWSSVRASSPWAWTRRCWRTRCASWPAISAKVLKSRAATRSIDRGTSNQRPDPMTTKTFKIAAIPGDGIGKEVMPEGMRVLQAAARRFDIELRFTDIERASCDHYAKTGAMMPADWKEQLQGHDAIYFGAVGWPATVPDHVSLWGSLLKFRREFDQYINLRPVRLFDGVPCPLAGGQPGDIDPLVRRWNTPAQNSNVGGIMYEGTDREIVIQESD